MKILHINPAMRSGGIEAMICGIANEMAKTEDVTVCSLFATHEDDLFWNRLAPPIHRISLGKTKDGFSIRTIFKIVKLIQEGGFDVINIHGFFYYYVLAIYLLKNKRQFFYTIHSDAVMENASWSKYLFHLKKNAFLRGYVHPITISSSSNSSFKNLYGISGKVIENGIKKPDVLNYSEIIEEARKTPNTKVFVHPGRITKAKNQLVLCRVFNTLIKEGYDVSLVIAGSKQDSHIFESIRPFFSDRIRFVGERKDVPNLLAHCDGMCLPSIWEGLPVTLLEALSVGCIPICSPVGGIVDVIRDGENGFLSKSSEFHDYLETIRSFLTLPLDKIQAIKKNAEQAFASYDIRITTSKYLEYYHHYIDP